MTKKRETLAKIPDKWGGGEACYGVVTVYRGADKSLVRPILYMEEE